MIEAVGWKDFGTFFDVCARRLEANGAMGLQAITVDDRLYDVEKASRTFIRKHDLPRRVPAVHRGDRARVARRTDLRMVDLEDITAHYPETLRRWRENLDANRDELARLGYDERFQRIWRLYLCWCEAGFAARRICRRADRPRQAARGTAPCPSPTTRQDRAARRGGRVGRRDADEARTAAALICGARIAYAVGLITAPEQLTRTWLGPPVVQPSTQIPLRGLAVREIGLATGGLLASLRRRAACVRGSSRRSPATSPTSLASVWGRDGIPPAAVSAVDGRRRRLGGDHRRRGAPRSTR